MIKLSEHFTTDEFKCKGNHVCDYSTDEGVIAHVNSRLITLLEGIREGLGKPVIITSGLRCPEHNKEVGGTDQSTHLRGEAADIKIAGSFDRYEIVMIAMTKGCLRIGLYKNQMCVHVDVATHGVAQDVLWIK